MTHRSVVWVLGDQLSLESPALLAAQPENTTVVMIEAPGEATAVWNHKARLVLFLSAMRHFAETLRARGWAVHYTKLDAAGPTSLIDRCATVLAALGATHLSVVEPGEYRLHTALHDMAERLELPLTLHADSHFLCSKSDFSRWADGRKSLRMEYFYREMRRRYQVLLTPKGEPEGGQWNFDAENRSGFPKAGPCLIPAPEFFEPDAITQAVMQTIERHFPEHPGELKQFRWPVTREQALLALNAFIESRLTDFGTFQDAMWTDTPFGWHALLSSSLNLHLISPLEVILAAQQAYRDGAVSLACAEGFIRQVLGWREFIRGVYWLDMPSMATDNFFNHDRPLPAWFWDGDTHMVCMRQTIAQTLEHGYAHHIQRLMVTGNFSLLAQLSPAAVSDWYLAVYVDAVEWVELPNVAGMALFANGGRFTSKPYIASGAYTKRMSNYCKGCRYDPAKRVGDDACPVTTLYWNFLDTHEAMLVGNPRTALMAKNIQRLSVEERTAIKSKAQQVLNHLDQC
jgi:deoxyribodipyrimidine photolyase-related protein